MPSRGPRQAFLSNRTQISPPSESDGGEIESGLLLGPRVEGTRVGTIHIPGGLPSDRPTIYKAIAPIALRSPYDLQGNRPDRPPIAPDLEEGDRNML